MITCPLCQRLGFIFPLHGPPAVGEGDYLMARRKEGAPFERALVVQFKHSPYKLINDGVYTYRFEDGTEQTSTHEGLQACCPRCLGMKEVDENPNDTLLLDQSVTFLVSGKGTIRAASVEDFWLKFLVPSIGLVDLLSREGKVFRPMNLSTIDDCYQKFQLEYLGDLNVNDDTPQYCDTHGWYQGRACDECP